MRCSISTVFAAFLVFASPATIPSEVSVEVGAPIQERQLISASIISVTSGSGIGTEIVKAATMATTILINKITYDWNEARQQFTQQSTYEMLKHNPDPVRFIAVACYNKGYTVQHQNNLQGLVSVKIIKGLLNTTPNTFRTFAEGGFQNLCYRFNPGSCLHDKVTSDLTCPPGGI